MPIGLGPRGDRSNNFFINFFKNIFIIVIYKSNIMNILSKIILIRYINLLFILKK